MALTAKVENYCYQHRRGTVKSITVDIGTRACINCIWYEQYYHQNRGNVYGFVPTDTGYCLLRDQRRGTMRQPCKDYETKEKPRPC